MNEHIQRGIDYAGSQRELARLIRECGGARQAKISQAHVSYWLNSGRVPTAHCRPFERAVAGVVTAAQLDPETFGAEAA